jgi:hypothetical protein
LTLPAPFVVGVPRSGTTLLRLLLDAHPDLAIPSETGFGLVLAERPMGYATPGELLDRLVELPTWQNLDFSRDELARLLAELPSWDAAEALRTFYRAYAARRGKPRWGDKTPLHVEHMPLIAAAFPEARFVHIIRDGRGVLGSMSGMSIAPGDGSAEAIAGYWRDAIACARKAAETLPYYHELRYEDLVTEPEPALRGLCEFIDLEFDPAMLRAHERAEERLSEVEEVRRSGGLSNVSAPRQAHFKNLLLPPQRQRAEAWRQEIPRDVVEAFERVGGETLVSLGYPLQTLTQPC